MKKKLLISIGIPALNEEANIGTLLKSLFKQKGNNFVLEEIIVVSDSSTDNTNKIIRSFKNKKVKLIVNKQRIGQALSQNKICANFKSDILILLNADIIPKNSYLLSQLVQPFYDQKNLGIVGGKVESMEAQTFIERVLNYSHQMKQEIYEKIGNQNNLYLCHGRVRAFSKKFISQFKWEPTYGEDAFSYLFCRKLDFDFYYQSKAIVLFRSPQTLKDHFKQSVRFFNASHELNKHFDTELIMKEYKIPQAIFLKTLIKYFLHNPVLMSSYLFMAIFAKIKSNHTNVSHVWDTSQSSKILTQQKISKT